jgi:glyoxylase-like metal-dependent hydrolase (beta-lactamase superfamily II)
MIESDLIIKRFICSPKDNNVYLLISGVEAAVVDAANCYQELRHALDERGAHLKYILVTHGHASHISSLLTLKKMGGIICLHPSDRELLKDVDSHLEPDLFLKDNESLKLGTAVIKILHTPGHTMGSLCFHLRGGKALFTGDTLFKGEFGKIRGPHSMGLMLRSLKRLNSVIPPKTTIYPGHGPLTVMSKEAWLDTLDNLS